MAGTGDPYGFRKCGERTDMDHGRFQRFR
jgi:hypothetical protein